MLEVQGIPRKCTEKNLVDLFKMLVENLLKMGLLYSYKNVVDLFTKTTKTDKIIFAEKERIFS